MEYQVVYGGHWQALAERVNEEIAKGWIPQGGVAVATDGEFFQAMKRGCPGIPA